MIGNVPRLTGKTGVIRCMIGGNGSMGDVGVDVFGIIMLAGANTGCMLLFSNVLTTNKGAIVEGVVDVVVAQERDGSVRVLVICELIVLILIISVP